MTAYQIKPLVWVEEPWTPGEYEADGGVHGRYYIYDDGRLVFHPSDWPSTDLGSGTVAELKQRAEEHHRQQLLKYLTGIDA